MKKGSEIFVRSLNSNGVDYIFVSLGVASTQIEETVSKFNTLGEQTPRAICGLNDFAAISAAYGFFMVSGKPQVLLIQHGLYPFQLRGALYDAKRGHAGIIICAPWVSENINGENFESLPFSQNVSYEQKDKVEILRDCVKWKYEIHSIENIHEVIERALKFASTEPSGPVYIMLPQDVLTDNVTEIAYPLSGKSLSPALAQPKIKLLEEIAELLIDAKELLIMTAYIGRNYQAVDTLIELTEILGARIISSQFRMNFPMNHPMYGEPSLITGNTGFEKYFKNADVILFIDHDWPYFSAMGELNPNAKIIHIDIDPLEKYVSTWGSEADITMECNSSEALPILIDIIRQKATKEDIDRFKERFSRYQSENESLRQQWYDFAVSKSGQEPISIAWLCRCIDEVIDEETIIIEEVISDRTTVLNQIHRKKPRTFFANSGKNIGWALGAALGAKLASPKSNVVTMVGDEAFILGNPIQTLWAAKIYKAPFLCVIFNNSRYDALSDTIRDTYGAKSYYEKTDQLIGIDIKPSPDYASIAQACGGYGLVVESPSEIKTSLKKALSQLLQGKPSVVDIKIQ